MRYLNEDDKELESVEELLDWLKEHDENE